MVAPIALFAFNRPTLLKQTLQFLAANELASESNLTIFCDGPRNEEEKALTDAVRAIAGAATGFLSLEVISSDCNRGCAGSVISGLDHMFARHETLIVMEDDFLCSPYTLYFLNDSLEYYKNEPVVFNIAAWSPPINALSIPAAYPYDAYFIPRFNSGIWASWRNRYEMVDWKVEDYEEFIKTPCLQEAFNRGGGDLASMLCTQMEGNGKIDSWAIRMAYASFKHGCLGLNPVFTHAVHIGVHSGTHYTNPDAVVTDNIDLARPVLRLPSCIFTNRQIVESYSNYYQRPSCPDKFADLRKGIRLAMRQKMQARRP